MRRLVLGALRGAALPARRLHAAGAARPAAARPDAARSEPRLAFPADPDCFGTLSRQAAARAAPDEAERAEQEYLDSAPLPSQKLTTKQYADHIKAFLKHKRLKEALDVLEVRMLREERVKPENYIYNILIGACADYGYTKKAFKLYNDMKRRDLKVTGDTYTCLFNACANSPWPSDGLKNARHLRELMTEKGIEPNLTNYNAMIKAFGRCGDISASFQIVDEMSSKKIKIRAHTFNFLLQSCITDKENGLRHALLVWRKMLLKREKPNIYSFNLMLKCVKDCNFGSMQDIVETLSVLATTEEKLQQIDQNRSKVQLLQSNENDKTNSQQQLLNQNPLSETSSLNNTPPNLLCRSPKLNEVVSLQEVKTPQEKFAFVGGTASFLEEMEKYNIPPDLKTMTQLLPLIPNTEEAERELIELMKKSNIRADIEFYNMLIKKRCLRLDYKGAKAVMSIIEEENKVLKKKHPMKKKLQIHSNLITYGVLAMTCTTKEEAEKLLTDMKNAQIKVNIEILGALLRQGTMHSNFGYVLYIMNTARDEKLRISETFMRILERFNEKCQALIQKDPEGKRKCSQIFVRTHGIYALAYQRWLSEVEDALKPLHPWKQFTERQPETVQRQQLIELPRRFYKPKRKFIKPYAPRV